MRQVAPPLSLVIAESVFLLHFRLRKRGEDRYGDAERISRAGKGEGCFLLPSAPLGGLVGGRPSSFCDFSDEAVFGTVSATRLAGIFWIFSLNAFPFLSESTGMANTITPLLPPSDVAQEDHQIAYVRMRVLPCAPRTGVVGFPPSLLPPSRRAAFFPPFSLLPWRGRNLPVSNRR